MSRLTKEEHEERLRMHQSGMSDVEMSERLYLSRHGVLNWRRRYGIPAVEKAGRPRKDKNNGGLHG